MDTRGLNEGRVTAFNRALLDSKLIPFLDVAVVIVSKTFTTGETILNSKTMRSWLIASLGQAVSSLHFRVPVCIFQEEFNY